MQTKQCIALEMYHFCLHSLFLDPTTETLFAWLSDFLCCPSLYRSPLLKIDIIFVTASTNRICLFITLFVYHSSFHGFCRLQTITTTITAISRVDELISSCWRRQHIKYMQFTICLLQLLWWSICIFEEKKA